jgi:transcriptional regulator of acetoin/glycerol metabolism
VSTSRIVGGVLDVQLISSPPSAGVRDVGAPATPFSAAVGAGASWAKCCRAVDRHLLAREWLVIEGEPGSGRETVGRAAHQFRTPAARLRVLAAEDAGPEWVADVAEELASSGGSLLLTGVDTLPVPLLAALAELLEPYRESTDADRPWVVATVGSPRGERSPKLAELLSCFPATVVVPPLRHHVEDVAELVPHLLARIAHGAALTVSPEAMRVLMHNRWPGNVDQLVAVLRKVIARRRTGVIELRDLPPECRSTTKRMLTPLESLECDAIVEALLDSRGSKVEAARRLSMSRATIYRKIRDYGISVPAAAEPVR